MLTYQTFLDELNSVAESDYAVFHSKLLKNDAIHVLGVRVPKMRQIAQKHKKEIESLFTFPDEYYEVTFVKLTVASLQKWEVVMDYLDRCVALIDNWAACDSFKPKCFEGKQQELLPVLKGYLAVDKEFYQRFVLTKLLDFYVKEEYLSLIADCLKASNTNYYYVHMAAAWLTAEVLVKFYRQGVALLKSGILDNKTHNKAITKANESYRLTKEQKDYLKTLKV